MLIGSPLPQLARTLFCVTSGAMLFPQICAPEVMCYNSFHLQATGTSITTPLGSENIVCSCIRLVAIAGFLLLRVCPRPLRGRRQHQQPPAQYIQVYHQLNGLHLIRLDTSATGGVLVPGERRLAAPSVVLFSSQPLACARFMIISRRQGPFWPATALKCCGADRHGNPCTACPIAVRHCETSNASIWYWRAMFFSRQSVEIYLWITVPRMVTTESADGNADHRGLTCAGCNAT